MVTNLWFCFRIGPQVIQHCTYTGALLKEESLWILLTAFSLDAEAILLVFRSSCLVFISPQHDQFYKMIRFDLVWLVRWVLIVGDVFYGLYFRIEVFLKKLFEMLYFEWQEAVTRHWEATYSMMREILVTPLHSIFLIL